MKRVIVTSLFLFFSIYAKWKNPTPIYVGPGDQTIDMVIADGAGGAAVLWHDGQTGWELMNIIDSAGNLKWDKQGVAVLMFGGDTTTRNPDMFRDSLGNYWIALEAHWYTPSESQDIYVQKISPTGQRLFGDDGVAVCTAKWSQSMPQLCSSGSGTIVAWEDEVGIVYAQRVGDSGEIKWTNNGIQVSDTIHGQPQRFGDLVSDSKHGSIVLYMTWIGSQGLIFVQRLDSLGSRMWSDTGVFVHEGQFRRQQYLPPAGYSLSDGVGGCIFFYSDDGLYGKHMGQRIDSSGNLLWDTAGVEVMDYFGRFSTVSDLGLYLSQWDGIPNHMSVLVRRLTLDGTTPWGDSGITVWSVPALWPNGTILPSICDNGILVWRDVDDDSGSYKARGLLAQRVDSEGNILWTEEVNIVGAEDIVHPNGYFPEVVSTHDKSGIVVWQNNHNGNLDIHSTRIDSLGNLPPGIEEQTTPQSPAALEASSSITPDALLLRYSLSPGEPGTLKLFDASGRMVKALSVHGQGEVKVETLSAGVYFARLEAGGVGITKKIVVVK